MNSPTRYSVLSGGADLVTELEIRKSRFIAHLRRVESEDAAREQIAELRRNHHTARHHCSAFVIGPRRDVQRSSDDGEPAGTAGVPMLEVLLNHPGAHGEPDLSDLSAVVVRYFGGIKLGAGGLVRAYSEAVGAALSQAPLSTREMVAEHSLVLSHAEAGRVEAALRQADLRVSGIAHHATSVTLTVSVTDRPAELAHARQVVAAATAGAGHLEQVGIRWSDR